MVWLQIINIKKNKLIIIFIWFQVKKQLQNNNQQAIPPFFLLFLRGFDKKNDKPCHHKRTRTPLIQEESAVRAGPF
jgi:hypothetical protein